MAERLDELNVSILQSGLVQLPNQSQGLPHLEQVPAIKTPPFY